MEEIVKLKIPSKGPKLKQWKPKSNVRHAKERTQRGASSAFRNATAPKGERVGGEGGRFSRLTDDQKFNLGERRSIGAYALGTGGAIGATGTAVALGPTGRNDAKIHANRGAMAANTRKLKNVEKAFRRPPPLITDVGTKAHRAEENSYKHFPAGKYGMAGIAIGGGALAPVAVGAKKKQKKTIARQEKKLAAQRQQLKGIQKMSTSAFGVDHGSEFSKADPPQKKMSTGREVTGTLFGGWHGAVAGKKGKKLGAAGTGFGAGIGGSAAGAVGAGLLTRGKGTQLGSQAGALGGNNWAVRRNQAKGRLKPEGQ